MMKYFNVSFFIYIQILILLFFYTCEVFPQSGWIHQFINNSNCVTLNFPQKDTGYISQHRGSLFKTTDRGYTWNDLNPGISFIGPARFTTALLGIVLGLPSKLTTNGGVSWNEVSNNLPGIGNVHITDQQFIDSNTGYYVGIDFYPDPVPCCYDGVIYKTTDSGLNWNLVYRHGAEQLQEIYFKDENNGIALDHIALVSTTNGGLNWVYNSSPFLNVRPFFNRSMTDPFKDTIYIAGIKTGFGADTGAIIKSTDKGVSWHYSLLLPYSSRFRKIFLIDNSNVFAVGDTGLIVKTTNGGENWAVLNSGTRKRLNGVSFINKDTGFVVGDSGLVLITFTGGLVGVSNELSVIPDKFILHQNYPNPFNPETIIRYQLSFYSDVSLKVFDVLGNEVAELVNIKQPAGSYSVKFDAGGLPSGIYFYRLDAGNFSQVKKMMVLK